MTLKQNAKLIHCSWPHPCPSADTPMSVILTQRLRSIDLRYLLPFHIIISHVVTMSSHNTGRTTFVPMASKKLSHTFLFLHMNLSNTNASHYHPLHRNMTMVPLIDCLRCRFFQCIQPSLFCAMVWHYKFIHRICNNSAIPGIWKCPWTTTNAWKCPVTC